MTRQGRPEPYEGSDEGLEREEPPLNRGHWGSALDIEAFIESLRSYGLAGLFLASLLSNLIPMFPAIYLSLVMILSAIMEGIAWKLIVILVGGIGAGLGKFIVFYTSNIVGKRAFKAKRRELEKLMQATGRSMGLIVFLFAALPLPDDVLYIPLGAAGYKPTTFLFAVTTGKIVLTAIVSGLGSTANKIIQWMIMSGDTGYLSYAEALLVLVIGTAIFLTVIYYVNWSRVLEATLRGGFIAGAKAFLLELKRLALSVRPKRSAEVAQN